MARSYERTARTITPYTTTFIIYKVLSGFNCSNKGIDRAAVIASWQQCSTLYVVMASHSSNPSYLIQQAEVMWALCAVYMSMCMRCFLFVCVFRWWCGYYCGCCCYFRRYWNERTHYILHVPCARFSDFVLDCLHCWM